MSLTKVTLDHGGLDFAVASDTVGSATSQAAMLTVDPTFAKITTEPVVSLRQ